jgi:hypothetical protein
MFLVVLNNCYSLFRLLERPTAPFCRGIPPNFCLTYNLWCYCILTFPDLKPISEVCVRGVFALETPDLLRLRGRAQSSKNARIPKLAMVFRPTLESFAVSGAPVATLIHDSPSELTDLKEKSRCQAATLIN